MRTFSLLVAGALLLSAACSRLITLRPEAAEWRPEVLAASDSPRTPRPKCTHHEPLRQAFFGDLHVHTRYSMDARSRNMLAGPDDALRFARGETIGLGPFDESGNGTRRRRLDRPLDFAAVTDHAEWIGEVERCTAPDSAAFSSEPCRAYRGETELPTSVATVGKGGRMTALIGMRGRKSEICGEDDAACRAALLTAWQSTQAATERWNDTSAACQFTAFHGWEHSYIANLSKVHRNVIFRNESVPELPISSLEAPEAIDLWDRLDALCTHTDTGCEALTIPHNANVSNGRLFEIPWKRESMKEQRRQARVRARMDRVVEIMQVKGESECRNGFAGVEGEPDDLCGFEKIRSFAQDTPKDCGGGIGSGALGGRGCQSQSDFARYALIEGLREAKRIGVNPFQFGMIGSTDGHNANPGDVEEADWAGCCANTDAEPAARLSTEPAFAGAGAVARNPGGLIGAFAEENTRDSIFDAIARRETFATSGPRIVPRFYGGFALPAGLCEQPGLVTRADAAGVPMGAVLEPNTTPGNSPSFVAIASRDPGLPDRPGNALDRLQIIKVWSGPDGASHQSVYDVAGRVADTPGSEPVSVDLGSCQPPPSGSDTLCAEWADPSFDPTQSAAYYVRVVETESCRWSWRTCLGMPASQRPAGCTSLDVPKTIQERAWTSPIWYEPTAPFSS